VSFSDELTVTLSGFYCYKTNFRQKDLQIISLPLKQQQQQQQQRLNRNANRFCFVNKCLLS
jgi:hypothetical protein